MLLGFSKLRKGLVRFLIFQHFVVAFFKITVYKELCLIDYRDVSSSLIVRSLRNFIIRMAAIVSQPVTQSLLFIVNDAKQNAYHVCDNTINRHFSDTVEVQISHMKYACRSISFHKVYRISSERIL